MIESSAAYQKAIVGDARRIFLRAIIDIISPDIVYGDGDTSGEAAYSRREQLHNKVFGGLTRYATLESNRWGLDGTWHIFPDTPAATEGEIGYLGDALSDSGGDFPAPPWVELQFSGVSVLQSCSVYFSDDEADGVPDTFTVDVKQGGTAYFSKTITGNRERVVILDGFTVNDPDAIRVTVAKWSLPSRRARVAEILLGVYEEWDADMLAAFDTKQQGDPSCVTLPYGTCTLKMDNLSRRFEPRSKNGIFRSLEERQGIDVSIGVALPGGQAEYKRVGVFYQYSGGWKTGDNGLTMQWNLVDIVGLLANREFVPPETLPTTLKGWVGAIVAQLGINFAERYIVDSGYQDISITATVEDVTGRKCGELLKYICMAAGVWARADAETGYLATEPLWNSGNKITLDNLNNYPTIKANNDLAAIVFTLHDGADTQYVVSGNATAASETVSVDNPFIHTAAQALTAARSILSVYGGNRYEITGRGDPSSEIGDVDTLWLNESSAATGRRVLQEFSISNGVLQGCKSALLQADGSFLYQERAVITQSGTWTAPAGKTSLRVILVGQGGTGTDGTDGSWSSPGEDGTDGLGALVWAGTIQINDGQSFPVSIGADTVFGAYSSANGERYANGFTDIASGDAFARTGVAAPLPGSGDGGLRGFGGAQGRREQVTWTDEEGKPHSGWKVYSKPGEGTAGVAGVTGCVVIYWDKEAAG